MVRAPRPAIMESGQGTGHVLGRTVEAVSAWALRRWQSSATRDLAEVCDHDLIIKFRLVDLQ